MNFSPLYQLYFELFFAAFLMFFLLYVSNGTNRKYKRNNKIFYKGYGICSLPKYDKNKKVYKIGGIIRPIIQIPNLKGHATFDNREQADKAFQIIAKN